jgi:acrylyl-CoA reductase (NADPH)
MFKALLLEQAGTTTVSRITSLDESSLPAGEVTVHVDFSTLNYKDALAITGKSPVVRTWPMVPGIDFAGTVQASSDARYRAGDRVVLNGWGVGETRWGGLAQCARAPADYLVPLPEGLSTMQAMAIGTAGYTAMLAVQALERAGVSPGAGEVLVTGANGGVGGFAIALLAGRGYRVVASTGRMEEGARLRGLGAAEVIDRATLNQKGKPLQKERWAGVIDSVGGQTLANACAATRYAGVVAACGLAESMEFPVTVAPFILRGVTLAGIDSVQAPYSRRLAAWSQLAKELSAETIDSMTSGEISLEQTPGVAQDLLAGKIKGRMIVNPNR